MKKIFALLIIITILLSACQRTPGKPAVKQKDDKLMEMIKNSKSDISQDKQKTDEIENEGSSDIDEVLITWEEEITTQGSGFDITIDIDNYIPDIAACPVYRVEPYRFTSEQIRQIKSNLYGDMPLYFLDPDNLSGRMTKTEIQERILEIKKTINDPNSEFNTAELSDEEYSRVLQEKQDSIKRLEKKYNSAPEEIVHNEIEINEETVSDGIFGYVIYESGKCSTFFLSAAQTEQARLNSLSCTFPRQEVYEYDEFTFEDALNCTREFTGKLDINDMTLDCCILKGERGNYKSYQFIFTKEYGGVNLTYTSRDIDNMSADLYTFPWKNEKLILCVDNTGVFDFLWDCPSKVSATLSESVDILGFDKIKEIFKNQIQYKVVWDNNEEAIVNKELVIDEVCLGMMRVSIKDSVDNYMVIPVYDFFGAEVLTYSGQQPGGYRLDENNQCTIRRDRFSYLTINAIDGSIIDRSLGY